MANDEHVGYRYSGGEAEQEVSDVGQAEAWAANLKGLFDLFMTWASTDQVALDLLQGQLHNQSIASQDEGRRNRDPLLSERLRQADQLFQDNRRQQEQGFQQTQQVGLQAIQNSLTHQANTNAIVVEALANMLEGSRVARDRTWTFTEQVERDTLQSFADVLTEAVRNTPLHPDKETDKS